MSVLIGLIGAEVRDSRDQIFGKVVSRPKLTYSDGENLTYAADVDIGVAQPSGEDVDTIGDDTILRLVPIAAGNLQVRYAEVGNPVTLTRTALGSWQISGFSKEMPGTYTRINVTVPYFDFGLPDYDVGDPISLGYEARPLTYAELATLGGGYGTAMYGAVGLFKGGELVEITA
jgi:hypothetical protein